MSLADRIAVFEEGRVRQVDEPVALYERPRTPFVAGFVGANNLFEGTADGSDGLQTADFGLLPGTPLEGLERGAKALLGVRPEKVELREEAVGGGLRGSVVDVSFYGGVSHISVDVPGHLRPILVAVQGAGSVQPGAKVGLHWRQRDAVVIPVVP
jgi:spermidine/putrescine transport system ATP-binding protein/putrescine transport system ATP-binding protein